MFKLVAKCILGVLTIVGAVCLSVYAGAKTPVPARDVYIITAFNEYGSISGTVFTHGISRISGKFVECVNMDSGAFERIPFKNLQIEEVTDEYNAQNPCLKSYEGIRR